MRPSATLIVPYAGTEAGLEALRERLGRVALGPGDEVLVADNRADAVADDGVVPAPGRASSYHARNAAAARARTDWLVFVDADCDPEPGLLDAYLDPAPAARVGVLAGAIADRAGRDTLVARYVAGRAKMSEATTLAHPFGPYAQTANCAVRRAAFEEVGGFADRVRSGGDADLCWRLAAAGWALDHRPAARVEHRNRDTLGGLCRQLARHGAGAAWLELRHPGSFPRPRAREVARLAGHYLGAAAAAGLAGDRERAAYALLDLAGLTARDLGRLAPNHAPPRAL